MVAIWNSLRPPADKSKKVCETPIPPAHLPTILPAWEEISSSMNTAKSTIDSFEKSIVRLRGTSLASAAAQSASMRVGRLLKVAKVRDLDKCLNALGAAKTKVNMAWAGLETQAGEKLVDDLVPMIENVVFCLEKVEERLTFIDRILNPKTVAEMDKSAIEKQQQAERLKRFEENRRKKKEGAQETPDTSSPSPQTATTSEPPSSSPDGRRPSIAGTPPLQTDRSRQPEESMTIAPPVVSSSYMNPNTALRVNKVARKFKEKKVAVDVSAQSKEFGDPMALLNMEREQPIGEPILELGEYFALRAEMRKSVGGFRPKSMTSKDIMGLMLSEKPRTAAGGVMQSPFKVKARGSRWGVLQKGVKGEVEHVASLPSKPKPVEEKNEPPEETKESPEDSSTEKRATLTLAAGISRSLSKRGSILRRPSSKELASDEMRSVKFEMGGGGGGKESDVTDNNYDDIPKIGEKNQILKEIETAKSEFRRESSQASENVDMEQFKLAFHQNNDAQSEGESRVPPEQSVQQPPKQPREVEGKGKGEEPPVERKNTTKLFKNLSKTTRILSNMRSRVSMVTSNFSSGLRNVVSSSAPLQNIFSRKKKQIHTSEAVPTSDKEISDSAVEYWRRKITEFDEDEYKSSNENEFVWMKLNLAIALKCKAEVEAAEDTNDSTEDDKEREIMKAEAREMFEEVKKVFPNDPTSYLRQGQMLAGSSVGRDKLEGKENLQKSVKLCNNSSSTTTSSFDSLKVDAMASYNSVAYENSDLKHAAECCEHILTNAVFYASDEALCTMAQICIRRGQYDKAQEYYSVLGKMLGEAELKKVVGGGRKQKYIYDRFQNKDLDMKNLQWAVN